MVFSLRLDSSADVALCRAAYQTGGEEFDMWRCFDALNKTVSRAIKDLPPYQVGRDPISSVLHR